MGQGNCEAVNWDKKRSEGWMKVSSQMEQKKRPDYWWQIEGGQLLTSLMTLFITWGGELANEWKGENHILPWGQGIKIKGSVKSCVLRNDDDGDNDSGVPRVWHQSEGEEKHIRTEMSIWQQMERLHLISIFDKKSMPLPDWNCIPSHYFPWIEQNLGNSHRVFFKILCTGG